MKHAQILKRSWDILWSYRTLWIFGLILALTTGSSFNGNGQASSSTNQPDKPENQYTPEDFGPDFAQDFSQEMEEFVREMEDWYENGIPQEVRRPLITTAIILGVVILLLIVVSTILRYVSETAVIKMVDEYEQAGVKHGIRQGFRIGWSRSAWRLFLIDLLIALTLLVLFGSLIGICAILIFLGFSGGQVTGVLSVVAGIGLLFIVLFLTILTVIAAVIMARYIYRSCVLDGKGVLDSIKHGYALTRQHLKDTGVLALIMLGINIAYPILMLPFSLLTLGISVLLGGGSAAVLGGILGVFSGNTSISAILPTIVVGGLVFLVVLILPLAFVKGFKLIYQSSAWTLAYREINNLSPLALDDTTTA